MIDPRLIEEYRRKKLTTLVQEVDALWGGTDEKFLSEYIAEVLKECSNDLQSAVACFEALKAQAIGLGKRMPKPPERPVEVGRGHGAFREHYEHTGKK